MKESLKPENKKIVAPSSVPPLEADEETGVDFTIPEDRNYERLMAKSLNEHEISAMKRLGYYLATIGLPIEEACELVRITPEELKALLEKHPYVRKYLRVKEIELKKDLLKILALQAKQNKNEKWAEWMLASKYPQEFGSGKKKQVEDEGAKMMGAMLQTIRQDNTGNTLVEKKALVMVNNGAGLAGIDGATSEAAEIKQMKQTINDLLE